MFDGSLSSRIAARRHRSRAHTTHSPARGRTVELLGLDVVAHLVVAEREVVQALSPAHRLAAVDVLQQAHALDLVLAEGALDEAPRVVELGLHGDVRLRELLLVLEPEDLR